jgi:hypothetical protein
LDVRGGEGEGVETGKAEHPNATHSMRIGTSLEQVVLKVITAAFLIADRRAFPREKNGARLCVLL